MLVSTTYASEYSFDIFSIIGLAISLIAYVIKIVKEENSEETDEYLKINVTTNHVKINKKLKLYDNANNIPKYVATPLPPLKFIQIGKICPKKAKRQDKKVKSGKYNLVITTGR